MPANVPGNVDLEAYEADRELFDGVDFCKRKIGLCNLIGLIGELSLIELIIQTFNSK
jgi:hypothetical protein